MALGDPNDCEAYRVGRFAGVLFATPIQRYRLLRWRVKARLRQLRRGFLDGVHMGPERPVDRKAA